MQNRLTIKDIARLSGVGDLTVSRVLNNESGVGPGAQHGEACSAVINQHGFFPAALRRYACATIMIVSIYSLRVVSKISPFKPCCQRYEQALIH